MSFEKKKRALITGASAGIGKETAIAFTKEGIDVALVSRSQEKLQGVVAAGVEAKAFAVDLSCVSQVKAKIQAIADEFGDIDILVNNAGIGYTGNLSHTSLEDWRRVIDLNLTSVFQCTMGILPRMRQRGKGTIINIASIAARQAFAGWGVCCVSKAGLLALSQTLAQEERVHGIRVSAICPGAVNTEIWDTETVNANFDRSKMLTAQTILHSALLPQEAVIEELTLMSNASVL